MQEIKLQILAQDIRESDIMHSGDCPITRSLKRAGMGEYRHTRCAIRTNGDPYDIQSEFCSFMNSNIQELWHLVWIAYARYETYQQSPQDFEFTLKIN